VKRSKDKLVEFLGVYSERGQESILFSNEGIFNAKLFKHSSCETKTSFGRAPELKNFCLFGPIILLRYHPSRF